MNKRLTVGAGVMSDEKSVVMGLGVSNVNPHSLENVTCCSQAVTEIFDPSPVRVVAQMLVRTGANAVEQLPVPS